MTDFEREDKELAEMMGDMFIDETAPMPEMPESTKQASNATHTAKAAQKPTNDPTKVFQDCTEWQPVKERNWMDNLKDCVKSTAIFGGLNLLFWYWQIAGLMDESVALPSMLVCAALAGFGVGKAAVRGNRK